MQVQSRFYSSSTHAPLVRSTMRQSETITCQQEETAEERLVMGKTQRTTTGKYSKRRGITRLLSSMQTEDSAKQWNERTCLQGQEVRAVSVQRRLNHRGLPAKQEENGKLCNRQTQERPIMARLCYAVLTNYALRLPVVWFRPPCVCAVEHG